jgi:hypothetical protein
VRYGQIGSHELAAERQHTEPHLMDWFPTLTCGRHSVLSGWRELPNTSAKC